jgi:hypothetical protein
MTVLPPKIEEPESPHEVVELQSQLVDRRSPAL